MGFIISWPKFRFYSAGKGAVTLTLQDNQAPTFPNRSGQSLYTSVSDHPQYMSTTRNTPTTEVQWNIENIKSTDRNDFFNFWYDTLSSGYNNFTIIDHRRRLLFDVSWDQWKEIWRKARGGIYTIDLELKSPYDWTPPAFAAYLMTDNTVNDFCLDSDSNLTLDGVSLYSHATDSTILRENGYALRIVNAGSIPPGAVSNTLSWKEQKGNDSISMFIQAKLADIKSGENAISLVYLTDGTSYIEIEAVGISASTKWQLTLKWKDGANAEETLTTYPEIEMTADTWYDIAIVADCINNKAYIYSTASAIASTWSTTNNFLNGLTGADINHGIATASITNFPTTTWTSLSLMKADTKDPFNVGDSGWVQIAGTAPDAGISEVCSAVVSFNSKIYGVSRKIPEGGRLYEWDGVSAWVVVAPKLVDPYINCLCVFNGKLYGGTGSTGLLYEWNGVDAWTKVADQLGADNAIHDLCVFNSKLYGSTGTGGVRGRLFEWNGTNAWTQAAPRYSSEYDIFSICVYNNELYAVTTPNAYLLKWNGTNDWVLIGQATHPDNLGGLCVLGSNLYFINRASGILYQWDGANITEVATTAISTSYDTTVLNGVLYVVTGSGYLYKWNGSNAWTTVCTVLSSQQCRSVCNDGDIIYAGTFCTGSTTGLLYKHNPASTDDLYGYLQNVFVFDDFLSPYQFNNLRRLCHLWNMKTERAPV